MESKKRKHERRKTKTGCRHPQRPAANPKTKTKKFDVGEVSQAELQQFLPEVKDKVSLEEYEMIERMAGTVESLFDLLGREGVNIRDLRKLFLGHTRPSEKTKDILGEDDTSAEPNGTDDETNTDDELVKEEKQDGESTERDDNKETPKGHGRNSADDYPGVEIVPVPHPDLKPGDACPACDNGTVYQQPPGKILRITGQPMLAAKVYEPEKLRCGLCGKVFTAKLPLEAGHEKYDAHAGSIIALMKYGTGMPFHRMETPTGIWRPTSKFHPVGHRSSPLPYRRTRLLLPHRQSRPGPDFS